MSSETAPDCRVAMVTAVEPDFDVVDMPFDEYLVKPTSIDGVRSTVERLLLRTSYREQRNEGYALASKVAALRAHRESEELERSEEYRALVRRLERIHDRLDATTADFESSDFVAAFADIGG